MMNDTPTNSLRQLPPPPSHSPSSSPRYSVSTPVPNPSNTAFDRLNRLAAFYDANKAGTDGKVRESMEVRYVQVVRPSRTYKSYVLADATIRRNNLHQRMDVQRSPTLPTLPPSPPSLSPPQAKVQAAYPLVSPWLF